MILCRMELSLPDPFVKYFHAIGRSERPARLPDLALFDIFLIYLEC